MRKGKILAVDDDRLVLLTVVHGLTQAGFEVLEADNGDEAILLARQHRPDLALLDIRMEGKSGFDVAQYLRDTLNIPFVFLSAFADEATMAEVERLGALAYMNKPLDITKITPIVAQAVERARANQQTEHRLPALIEAPRSAPYRSTDILPSAMTSTGAHSPAELHNLSPIAILAIGIIMHRLNLGVHEATEWLKRKASRQNQPLDQLAVQMVDALQTLVQPE